MSDRKHACLDVEFGGVSIGSKTARLGVKARRDQLLLEDAAHYFSGARLQATVEIVDQQMQLPTMDNPQRLDSVVDAKTFITNPDEIRTGLTFSVEDTNLAMLVQFARQKGRLHAERIGNADGGEDDPSEQPEESEGDDETAALFDGAPGQQAEHSEPEAPAAPKADAEPAPVATGPGAYTALVDTWGLEHLALADGTRMRLEEHGITSIGVLHHALNSGEIKRVKGIGDLKITAIREALDSFYKDRAQARMGQPEPTGETEEVDLSAFTVEALDVTGPSRAVLSNNGIETLHDLVEFHKAHGELASLSFAGWESHKYAIIADLTDGLDAYLGQRPWLKAEVEKRLDGVVALTA